MKILDQIIISKKKEVELLKQKFSYKDYEASPFFSQETRSLKEKLGDGRFGIISELKRKSPSAGYINKHLDVVQQAQAYEASGAIAISCLTDYFYFGGSCDDLRAIKPVTTIPILRKEFIIDEVQLFESRAIGADVILLIAEVLTKQQALHLTIMAQSLGMEVIMECHRYSELKKVNDLVDVIGVNNRDLQAQKTDIQTSFDLYNFIPEGKLCISESGIKSREDLVQLYQNGYHGALIGEHILSNSNPSEVIKNLQLKSVQTC